MDTIVVSTNISPLSICNTDKLNPHYDKFPAEGWIHPCCICNIPTFQMNSNNIYQCYNCQKITPKPKQTCMKCSYYCILSALLFTYIIKICKK